MKELGPGAPVVVDGETFLPEFYFVGIASYDDGLTVFGYGGPFHNDPPQVCVGFDSRHRAAYWLFSSPEAACSAIRFWGPQAFRDAYRKTLSQKAGAA